MKKKIYLPVLFVGILLLVAGISFAWLQVSLSSSKKTTIKAGTLAMELDDSTSNGIVLENAIPVYDDIGMSRDAYTFKVTNTGTIISDCEIYLQHLFPAEGEESLEVLRYSISNNKDLNRIGNFRELAYGVNELGPKIILDTRKMAPGEEITYELHLWVDSFAEIYNSSGTFRGELGISALQEIEYAPNTLAAKFLNLIGDKYTLREITFLDKKEIPATALESWDVSAVKDGSVMAYVEPSVQPSTRSDISIPLYDLYVVADGKIKANPDSSFAFAAGGFGEPVHKLETITFNNNFDTSNVTDMSYMFAWDYLLTTLDLSFFDTSQVGNMMAMFAECGSLTNLDLSSFNTSRVENMMGMFTGCTDLTTLDTSNFDTSKVRSIDCMFAYSGLPTTYDYSHFNLNQISNGYKNPFECHQ